MSFAVTAAVPETVAFPRVAHELASEGLVETVQATVPVYPVAGVIVIVEAPEPPWAMVSADALRLKVPVVAAGLPTVTVAYPVEAA